MFYKRKMWLQKEDKVRNYDGPESTPFGFAGTMSYKLTNTKPRGREFCSELKNIPDTPSTVSTSTTSYLTRCLNFRHSASSDDDSDDDTDDERTVNEQNTSTDEDADGVV
jgi:hypothetical protein